MMMMRTENEGLLALFFVRQGDGSTCNLIDWGLASPAFWKPSNCWQECMKKLQIALNVYIHRCRQQPQAQCLYDCLPKLTLLTLQVWNYTILLIALRLPVRVISDLKFNQSISPGGRKIAPASHYFPSSGMDNNTHLFCQRQPCLRLASGLDWTELCWHCINTRLSL